MRRNLVCVSDLHVGSRVGLMPLKARMLDGGEYRPSVLQRKLHELWRYFWSEWVPRKTKGGPFSVLVNGDALDGEHHNTRSIWSGSPVDQCEAAYEVLAPIRERAEEMFFLIGTAAHEGEMGDAIEGLAGRLDCKKDENGRHCRYEAWIWVGRALCHFAHTIGTTGSANYETTAVLAEMIAAFGEAGMWGDRPPNFVVRAHRHRYAKATIPAELGDAESLVLPGWQLKTPFIFRTARGRLSPAQVGGALIRAGEDGEVYELHKVWPMKRPREER